MRKDKAPHRLSLPGAGREPKVAHSFVGLIEATSNRCDDAWARRDGVAIIPTATGTATAIIPATASPAFLARVSSEAIRLLMMFEILFFRFEPLTPAAHGTGDSRYNSHTL